MQHGLGRHPAPDERDQNYPLRALLEPVSLPDWRYWYTGSPLDQGRSSACVGFSWRKFLHASPLNTKTGPGPMQIYREAQLRDPWPGEEPSYYGTSVRAGVKYLQELGHIQEYRWSWSADEIARWILTRGCVVVGTDWRESMFYPDREGFIKPTGASAGGHAYTLCGYSRPRGAFRLINSWGDWGENGRAFIAGEDLQHLLDAQGEACTAIERAAS